MRRVLALPVLMLSAPLAAQSHDHHQPEAQEEKAAEPAPAPTKPAMQPMDAPVTVLRLPGMPEPEAPPPIDHGAMGHGKMGQGGMDHGKMDHGAMGHGGAPAQDDPPPSRALAGPRHAADAIWGEAAMAVSRTMLAKENGGMQTGMVLVERLETRIAKGEEEFVWDAQGWYGGDINRFVLKTEGEGAFRDGVEDAEVQLLYSRAIGPFFDLQAGARVDFEPETRSHLVLGVQGLAPYMFHVDGAVFLSDRGDLTAEFKGEYDQKITQRLILQPRAELKFSAQDIPVRDIGAGLTKIEAGVRLRYEIAREFAPYIGVEYEAKLGQTADIARAAGEDAAGFAVLAGIRTWF